MILTRLCYDETRIADNYIMIYVYVYLSFTYIYLLIWGNQTVIIRFVEYVDLLKKKWLLFSIYCNTCMIFSCYHQIWVWRNFWMNIFISLYIIGHSQFCPWRGKFSYCIGIWYTYYINIIYMYSVFIKYSWVFSRL